MIQTTKLSVLAALCLLAIALVAGSPAGGTDEQTIGLFVHEPDAFGGYTLFAPWGGPAYLIDNDGRLVHTWDGAGGPSAPYLLEDGSLIRLKRGGVRRFAWDGTLTWDFSFDGTHHDIEVLPNGNVLMIVKETRPAQAAIAEGRDPDTLGTGELWADAIVEVEPVGASGGNVVWSWHSWDHLVQDHDPARANYADVGEHPELIDINFIDPMAPTEADWQHTNAIDYNEDLDQIVLSVRHFSEIWVIDHSTTTEEAASHSGGNSGRGGDLLYRWGNPQTYGAGDADDQQLFWQHDANWIPSGFPGAGNILVFNNGPGRPGGDRSSVDEIVPPDDGLGNYALAPGEAYGPAAPTWTYMSDPPSDFYSRLISSARRLPNGNTLIDSGDSGTFFEVTPDGETVWRYVNPTTLWGPLVQGDPIPGGPVAQANHVFRAYRYAPDYPGLAGRDLTPGGVIELPKPTPQPLLGDVDGDGSVTSVDALLTLQFNAGLVVRLPEVDAADVNDDGLLDSVDAVLMLQVTAGLLGELPA